MKDCTNNAAILTVLTFPDDKYHAETLGMDILNNGEISSVEIPMCRVHTFLFKNAGIRDEEFKKLGAK